MKEISGLGLSQALRIYYMSLSNEWNLQGGATKLVRASFLRDFE
jgi:hypothetical protein